MLIKDGIPLYLDQLALQTHNLLEFRLKEPYVILWTKLVLQSLSNYC